MKKFLVLGTVLLIILLVAYRQRVFLRDPLGKVERGGVRLEGARVFINYSNDVLVEEADGARRFVVQHGGVPGVPKKLDCLRGMICWTEANVAEVVPLGGAEYRPDVQMRSDEVSFVDGDGRPVRVKLR